MISGLTETATLQASCVLKPDASVCMQGDGKARVRLYSSGTTGKPKAVCHDWSGLTAGLFREGAAHRCWLLCYTPSSFAGLQVILTAMLNGHDLLVPTETAPPAEVVAMAARNGVDAVSATPAYWRALMMAGASEKLELAVVTLGGDIADQGTLTALRESWPRATLRHIYATTEAGVVLSVTDGRPGFPAEKLDGGCLRLRNGVLQVKRDKGWIDTGDLIAIEGERAMFAGRVDDRINVGGEKIDPVEIERELLTLCAVKDACVYGRRNPITGALVAADIVSADEPKTRSAVDAWMKALPPTRRPRVIRYMDRILLNANGKKVRGLR